MPRKKKPPPQQGQRVKSKIPVLSEVGPPAHEFGTVEAVNPEPMGLGRELLIRWSDGVYSWMDSEDLEVAS